MAVSIEDKQKEVIRWAERVEKFSSTTHTREPLEIGKEDGETGESQAWES